MNPAPVPDPPVYSLATRKALRIVILAPMLAVFVVVLLHHKGFIDIESFGIPESYAYAGMLGTVVIALGAALLTWRCPGCGSHLGNYNPNPDHCDSCGAQFR